MLGSELPLTHLEASQVLADEGGQVNVLGIDFMGHVALGVFHIKLNLCCLLLLHERWLHHIYVGPTPSFSLCPLASQLLNLP